MSTEFRLPQISMGMQEAVINEWFKAVGDLVHEGDVLVEVEAEKGIVEIESPATGVVTEILVPAGDIAPVLSVLALIGDAGAAAPPQKETPTPVASSTQPAEAVRVPLTGVRGTIARRMHESLQSMAQLTLFRDIDVTDLLARRGQTSFTDLLSRACILSLGEHPRLNSWIVDGEVLEQPAVHLGCAVDLPVGLIVPVVRDAQSLPLAQLAAARRELIDNVRGRRFGPEEVTGSTFTISNLGTEGIDAFTPIINLPEVAILGVGRTVERACRYGQEIEWRTFVTLSLTFDHRALDGAPAARFLSSLAARLEQPSELLTEAVHT